MTYNLDWATADIDGDNILVDGGSSVNAVVTTPSGNGSYYYNTGGSAPGTLKSDNPDASSPSELSVDFQEVGGPNDGDPTEVSNVSFNIHDIDNSGNWSDLVSITAYDINGDPIPDSQIVFTNTSGANTVGSNSVGSVGGSTTGDFVTVTITGNIAGFTVTYTDGSSQGNDGWISLNDVTFDDPIIICFVKGSLIETENGAVAIEDLCVGDKVKTLDNGFQAIRWIGSTQKAGFGNLAPIHFKKGAIGNSDDLFVSPAHRILLTGWQAELLFGEAEFLTSAKSMINDKTIVAHPQQTVEYFHILFDRHEIIFSNGAATESFHPGEAGMGAMSAASRDEILSLFPQLQSNAASYGPAARETLMPHEVALMNA